MFWERKGISSVKFGTIDLRIRKAYGQIMERQGGLVLDFSRNILPMEKIRLYVVRSVKERARGTTDIIVRKDTAYIVLRAKK